MEKDQQVNSWEALQSSENLLLPKLLCILKNTNQNVQINLKGGSNGQEKLMLVDFHTVTV